MPGFEASCSFRSSFCAMARMAFAVSQARADTTPRVTPTLRIRATGASAAPGRRGDPLYEAYHDEEWGVPLHDDRALFELLCLEGAQAGLAWITILRKRESYRSAFLGFELERVAAMTDAELEERMSDPGIVRNRLKVFAVRKNARAFLEVQAEHGSFDAYLWGWVDGDADPRRARKSEGISRHDAARREDQQGPEEARLHVRRPDDRLRVPAVDRGRQRPPRECFRCAELEAGACL